MKTTKYIFSVILLALYLHSCSFFNEDTKSYLTEEQVYESIEMIKNNALLSVYQYIGGSEPSEGLQGTIRGVYDLNSITTDEQYIPVRGGDWYDGGYWTMLSTHTWTPTDESLLDTWNYLFRVITLCTQNIHNIENSKATFYNDSTQLNDFIAELRALRAIYYFYAMDLFGNIPILTYQDILDNDIKQHNRKDVYKYVVAELTDVLPQLKNEYSQHEGSEYYGRVTCYVAEFLLVKLCMNAQIYADNDWSDNEYPSADTILIPCFTDTLPAMSAAIYYAELIDNAFTLEPHYQDNFTIYNDKSSENIFTIPVNYLLNNRKWLYFHRSRHYNHGAALGVGGENGTCATLETLKAYNYPQEPDPRFDYNFYYEYVTIDDDTVKLDDGRTPLYYAPLEANQLNLSGTEYEKTAGARIRKYEFDKNAISDGTIGNNDIVLFRYADVILMKAEAQARLELDPTHAINEIRKRAGADDLTDVTLEDIYKERWRELMWEGWHRNDMIRFHHFTDQTSVNQFTNGAQYNYTTVFPIPQDILDMNPKWQQNKGYEY